MTKSNAPPGSMSLGTEVRPLQEAQLQIHSTYWSSVLVSAVANLVQHKLVGTLEAKYQKLLHSPAGQDHVVYRLTADILRGRGNEQMRGILSAASETSGENMINDIHQNAGEDAERALNVWSQNAQHYYAPDRQMAGDRSYNQWLTEMSSSDEKSADYVPGLLEVLEQRFRLQSSREIFDRVRTAHYRPMHANDAQAVTDSYMKAWLDKEALQLLVKREAMSEEQIAVNIRTFREKVNKGVFIWPLVKEQLERDLAGATKEKTGMELRGRVLQSQDSEKKILCWATYLHAPGTPTRKHQRYVRKYFNQGVTDANMYIEDPKIRQHVMDNIGGIELFQDIRSNYPLAADRFGAMMFEEMRMANANLTGVTAYRLANVESRPELELLKEAWRTSLYPAENEKSAKKFGDWGFRHIAWDYKQDGIPSIREGVEGIPDGRLELIPRWDVMYGNILEIIRKSREVWHKIQLDHGDVSADPLIIRWPV